jgi:hypothetical protein
VLDLLVHHRLHGRAPRVAENAAAAQCSRTKLHASIEPADNLLRGQQIGHHLQLFFLRRECSIASAVLVEHRLDLLVREARSQKRRLLSIVIHPTGHRARSVQQLVPDKQRRAQRATGVTGGRLNPDMLERSIAENAAISHAVKRYTAGQAKLAPTRAAVGKAGHAEHDLLDDHLS